MEVIQVSEKALRLIWLIGFASWAGAEAYTTRLVHERLGGSLFDPAAWTTRSGQRSLDATFDYLLRKVRELESSATLEDFAWPDNVPFPTEGLRLVDVTDKATFDLICIAGAFVFAHELRHALFDRNVARPTRPINEEQECDRWAHELLLDGLEDYAKATKQDGPSVRAKRILGITVAQFAILTLTPRNHWEETTEYPAVRSRLRFSLDAATQVPE